MAKESHKALAGNSVPIRAILRAYVDAGKVYPKTGLLVFLMFGAGEALQIFLRLYYRDIFDLIAGSEASPALWPELMRLFVIIVVIMMTINVLWRIGDACMTYMQANVLRDLTNTGLERLSKHSYSFFVGSFAGGLVAKLKRFVRAFETMHDKLVFSFMQTGIQIVGVLVVLFTISQSIAWFFFGWIVVYIGIVFAYTWYRRPFDLAVANADSRETGDMADAITNMLNIKMFATDSREMERFHETTLHKMRVRLQAWTRDNWFRGVQSTVMVILELVGMYMALKLWVNGEISAGTIILIQTYFMTIQFSTWALRQAMSEFFRAISDAQEMVEILETPLEVSDPSSPEVSRIEKGSIELRDAGFQYQEGANVFSKFTLQIPAGQKVGIVGHSGAGKSTLFKLLLRFIDVTDGGIAIDGQDIRKITQDDLRRRISYVPQDAILFHRSLYENIAYARPDATKEEVIAAAKRAHAHDFISQLPLGYDTLVGERGVKLSGGERQRVALARVILKDAPILLLDEATSSLDSKSEKYIQEQLTELMQSRTTLAIAHRISTITQMDRILVIDQGRIVEDGSHEELLANNGVYAELWGHQSHGFLVE